MIHTALFSLFLAPFFVIKSVGALEPKRYENIILESLDTDGRVTIEETQILGDLSAKGNIYAEEAIIGKLSTIGQIELKNCRIDTTSSIIGCLNADKTTFQDQLIAQSQKITLRSCSIHSIYLKKVDGYDGIQIIDLRDGTQVFGPITVESHNGEIWISSDSEVQGAVIGAKICKK